MSAPREIRAMRVRDVMTTTVATVTPDRPLRDVARLLVDRGISGVPVVDDHGAVLGIVSEADFLAKESGPEPGRHRLLSRLFGESADATKAEARTAGEAMTAPPITIAPDALVRDAAATMVDRRVNRLPVVEDGRLVGIVTRADLVRVFTRSDAELAAAVVAAIAAGTSATPMPGGLDVEVRDGIVHLAGTVDRRSLAETAAAIARDVGGVVRVDDHLTWIEDDVHRHTLDPDRASYMDLGGPQP
jgi:CBS domain-containing protein